MAKIYLCASDCRKPGFLQEKVIKAQRGDEIMLSPGIFELEGPLQLPNGVGLHGSTTAPGTTLRVRRDPELDLFVFIAGDCELPLTRARLLEEHAKMVPILVQDKMTLPKRLQTIEFSLSNLTFEYEPGER